MSAPSPYAVAIDATRSTLTRRTASYRDLVVAVVLIGGVAIGLALGLGRWWPLSIVSTLPAAVLTFAWRDAALLRRWRAAILRDWSAGDLRLDVLATTLRQVPGLPPATLAGMLGALPVALEAALPAAARGVGAAAQSAVGVAAGHWLLGLASAAWGCAAVLVAAAFVGSVAITAALLAPIAGLWVWRGVLSRRLGGQLRASRAELDAASPDSSPGWTDALDWQGVPTAMRP